MKHPKEETEREQEREKMCHAGMEACCYYII
jgi:hypothetical protein